MSLQQCYINGLLAGVFDVGVCRVIPAEETSAVGILPASIPLKSRRVLAHMPLMAEHVRELFALRCFCKSKVQRQLHGNQSGLSGFL